MDRTDIENPAGLEKYPAHVQASIRSEAQTWRYGDVASALSSFEATAEWARAMNQEQRKWHAAGFWYANQLLSRSAVALVQREMGDDPNCDGHLCPPTAPCHPRPATPAQQ
ncbi:hypothetical protein [Streptomyces sp. JL7001]|uniref:hypothetical protein n=1 Tax=Streptomyces sp. JL7001 TaxID=3445784 RepID=UPI003F7A1A7F